MKIALGTQLLVIALLAGCATPGSLEDLEEIPAAKLAAINAMPEVGDKELAMQPYETLGRVESVSCRRSYRGPAPSWEETVRRTKYEAMKKGANAIANLACGPAEGPSLTKLCFDSIRCAADAILLKQ
jgi:hypothetical protein